MKTMAGCNQIKRLIDEADHPESLSFEALSHVAVCSDCRSFADQRAGLRKLLASGTRVTAPMNFNALLNEQLARTKAKKFAWLSPSGYLRLGAATAMLVVMAFAAQFSGLFERDNLSQQQARAGGTDSVRPPTGQIEPSVPVQRSEGLNGTPVVPGQRPYPAYSSPRGIRYSSRVAGSGVPVVTSREDYLHEDGGVMLVRGPNGDREVRMPMVSVGAQPLVYVGAGAGRRTMAAIGTSF